VQTDRKIDNQNLVPRFWKKNYIREPERETNRERDIETDSQNLVTWIPPNDKKIKLKLIIDMEEPIAAN
jgi:hypothetical protein